MKRRTILIMALSCVIILSGCGGNGGGERTGGVRTGTYSGVVTDRFTEGSGADTADVLAVDTGGETIYFTIIDSTQFTGAEDVSVGDNVEVQCEEYSDSSYRPIRSLQAAESSAPQPTETQEITGTVANLSLQQTTADLYPEDADMIAELVERGSWTGALSDCASDCVLTINTESFLYHSDCGTFNDNINGKSLTLTDAQRETVNQILESYITLGTTIIEVEQNTP